MNTPTIQRKRTNHSVAHYFSAPFFANRGISHFQRGNYHAAILDFNQAMAMDPQQYSWLFLCRGAAHIFLGSYQQGDTDLNHHLRLYPETAKEEIEKLKRVISEKGSSFFNSIKIPKQGIYWKTLPNPQEWRNRLQQAVHAFGEMEYLTVLEGVRSMMFRNLSRNDPFYDRLKKDGAVYKTLFHVKRYEGFANEHFLTTPEDPDSLAYTVVAKDHAVIEEVAEIYDHDLTPQSHARLGTLLGFPDCCTQFFNRVWLIGRILDPLYEAGINTLSHLTRNSPNKMSVTVQGHPYCNTLLRYIEIRSVSWLTCSFDCPSTIKRALEWVYVGKRQNPSGMNHLLQFLSLPMKWECIQGAPVVRTKYFHVVGCPFTPKKPCVIYWESAFDNHR